MSVQASPQHVQSSVPPDAYGVDAPVSRYQYPQPSPSGENFPNNTPQSSRRPSKRPSGNGQTSHPNTPQQSQYRSPTGPRQPPNSSRSQAQSPSVRSSSLKPTNATSPLNPSSQQEQEQSRGPPFPPPARTSSNQRSQNPTSPVIQLVERTANSSQVASSNETQSRPARTNNAADGRDDRQRAVTGDFAGTAGRERPRDDTATAAASAARARRRGPTSPEGPQRSASTRDRDTRKQSSPMGVSSRSAANVQAPMPPSNLSREDSEVINRLVVTDPQVDVDRERERLAEAVPASSGLDVTPVTGLSVVGSEGVDDGGRGAGQSRHDHSSTPSRRKETKFGEYVLGQTLGEGEFGKVKLGWKKDGSVQVAIKLIMRESLGTNPSRLPKIYREISILRELQHPNIVRLHEMVETDRHIGIILEYASGGELFDYILNHRYLKDNAARRLFAQLVSGVGYLHKKGIVHRDLKLENLLLDRNRNIIITDFGFANTFDPRDELGEEVEYNLSSREYVKKMDLERVLENGSRRGDLMQTSCGSPCYAAPELVVTDSLYTGRKVDVWSCGVILYAMLAGYLPFDDDPANPEGDNINLLYKYIVSTPLTFPEYVTPHARDLLRRILVPDPRKRADLFEVARHSWLSEYAHVVSHVTSSTTTVGEISRVAVSADERQDAPLLARSASVREPTKPLAPNLSPVGGLSHQGKLDPENDKAKGNRDPKRRTVQVEYVAPQSQTARGELSPLNSPATGESPSAPSTGQSKSRARAPQPVEVPRQTNASKPLPQDPPRNQNARQSENTNRVERRPVTSQQGMPPPTRPSRDIPRSVSDSTNAFGQTGPSTVTRPSTGGSMTSNSGGRLPSRGNSYSQPLAPTVAVTNAQGHLARPKNGKQYNISAPIPQPEPYIFDASMGRPSISQAAPQFIEGPPAPVQRDQSRGHKRSNTLGNVFGRSGSIFGGRSQPQSPQGRQPNEKRYPPVSMKGTMSSDSPRQSSDSRRGSFGFSRKNSDLAKQDKPRRFSLLPASFSFKGLTGGSKDPSDSDRPVSQRNPSVSQPQPPPSRGQSKPQGMAFGRGASRSNSFSTENSVPIYDGQQDRTRLAQQPRRKEVPLRDPQQPSREPQYGSSQYLQPLSPPARPLQPEQSYLLSESAAPTNSELSVAGAPRRPQYPPGFNSYDEEPRPSMQQSRNERGPDVLQKNNRKFADAYEQSQDSGHHAGSSGAARRVMDFFRRRGKARAGEDR